MEITIDEWIVHFIFEPHKREVAVKFLEKVHQKCDKIVTLRGSNLDQKIWDMAKSSQSWDVGGRRLAKWFMGQFRNNSNKFHALEELGLEPLSVDLEREIPQDDIYLVKTALGTQDRLIVTTDGTLKERLSNRQELTVRFVEEFLEAYNC